MESGSKLIIFFPYPEGVERVRPLSDIENSLSMKCANTPTKASFIGQIVIPLHRESHSPTISVTDTVPGDIQQEINSLGSLHDSPVGHMSRWQVPAGNVSQPSPELPLTYSGGAPRGPDYDSIEEGGLAESRAKAPLIRQTKKEVNEGFLVALSQPSPNTVRTDNDIHFEESAQEQPLKIKCKNHGCGNIESNTGNKGEDNTRIISEYPSVMQTECYFHDDL